MSIPKFTQDPTARLDYELTWVLPAGDTIVASTWTAADPAILIAEDDTFEGSTVVVWVRFENAVVGETYSVVNHITTAAGRENDQTIKFKIKEL